MDTSEYDFLPGEAAANVREFDDSFNSEASSVLQMEN